MVPDPILTNPTQWRDDWQLAIDVDMVLRSQGADPRKIRARHPLLVALAEKAIAEGRSWIHPRAAFRRLAICEARHERIVFGGGGELRGIGVAQKLAQAKEAVIAVATIGEEFDRRVESIPDLLWQLTLDGYGTAAIGALAAALRDSFVPMAKQKGLRATISFYPGMKGWDLASGQTQIFSLLDTSAIGVALNPSFLMIPRKSISMIVGFAARVLSNSHSCDECSMSAECRYKPATS